METATRRVNIIQEGVRHENKTLIVPGALTCTDSQLPVVFRMDHASPVGFANGFHRAEDGWISFSITIPGYFDFDLFEFSAYGTPVVELETPEGRDYLEGRLRAVCMIPVPVYPIQKEKQDV